VEHLAGVVRDADDRHVLGGSQALDGLRGDHVRLFVERDPSA
jgi:hypothetical protein